MLIDIKHKIEVNRNNYLKTEMEKVLMSVASWLDDIDTIREIALEFRQMFVIATEETPEAVDKMKKKVDKPRKK